MILNDLHPGTMHLFVTTDKIGSNRREVDLLSELGCQQTPLIDHKTNYMCLYLLLPILVLLV